ncbi:MAG: hypothetical protein WD080_05270 [Egibacteraceae bacterium]
MAEEPTSDERRAVRFEATVHPGEAGLGVAAMTERVADLDVDRIPDPGGEVRLLVDADACVRLLEEGFEVRLRRSVPVRPLDPGLVAGDDEVQTWFDTRIRDTGGGPEQGTPF